MSFSNDILTLMLFLAACAGLVGFMLAFSAILGPKKQSAIKDEPFECGIANVTPYSGNFSVKFYLIALLFLLFDIEIAFLFPWATIFKSLGLFGFIEMFVFLAVVVSGLVYAWKKGALEWD
ncbi:MAG: NADH-quinone oxidoreductase subunit A [Acidobacteria bacterium]|nr:NADH-quinone oxidoreductase subunit A [Acidobacteriota bacterium]